MIDPSAIVPTLFREPKRAGKARLVSIGTVKRPDGATMTVCTHVKPGRRWPREGAQAAARRRRQMGMAA